MYYTKEQQNDFNNSRPGIPVDAVMMLWDTDKRLLIVNPNYKHGWSLPGGMSEAGESPLDTIRRETHEEVGLDLSVDQIMFAGARYVAERDGRLPYMQLVFESQLDGAQCEAITIQDEELSDYRFVTVDALAKYADAPRMQAVIAHLEACAEGKQSVYVENETVLC